MEPIIVVRINYLLPPNEKQHHKGRSDMITAEVGNFLLNAWETQNCYACLIPGKDIISKHNKIMNVLALPSNWLTLLSLSYTKGKVSAVTSLDPNI